MAKNANNMTLVLDWSNLMYRSLFVNSLFHDAATYDFEEDVNAFMGKFCTDISYILKTFKPNVALIAKDSHAPWRQELLEGVNEGYKGNRHKDARVNWGNIFKASDKLIKLFEKHGVHVATADHAEADDMMALCKEAAFADGKKDIIIVSADADIRQLADFNRNTHQVCAVYNTIAKGKDKAHEMFVTEEFIEWLSAPESNDIFSFSLDTHRAIMKRMLEENPYVKLVKIDPDYVALHKIFCGDDGDNVPSMYEWYVNGKRARVTESKCKKVVENLSIKSPRDLDTKTAFIKDALETVLKHKVNDIDVPERVTRQRKLVELNSELFPKDIKGYKETIACMMQDEVDFDYSKLKARDIMNGSAFSDAMDKKRNVVERAVFNDINKYVDKLDKLF